MLEEFESQDADLDLDLDLHPGRTAALQVLMLQDTAPTDAEGRTDPGIGWSMPAPDALASRSPAGDFDRLCARIGKLDGPGADGRSVLSFDGRLPDGEWRLQADAQATRQTRHAVSKIASAAGQQLARAELFTAPLLFEMLALIAGHADVRHAPALSLNDFIDWRAAADYLCRLLSTAHKLLHHADFERFASTHAGSAPSPDTASEPAADDVLDRLQQLQRLTQQASLSPALAVAQAAFRLAHLIKRQSALDFRLQARATLDRFAQLAQKMKVELALFFPQALYLHELIDVSHGRCKAWSSLYAQAWMRADTPVPTAWFDQLKSELETVRGLDLARRPPFADRLAAIDDAWIDVMDGLINSQQAPRVTCSQAIERLAQATSASALFVFSARHCMLLAGGRDRGRVHFYDPNIGAFEGPARRMKAFLSRYFSDGLGASYQMELCHSMLHAPEWRFAHSVDFSLATDGVGNRLATALAQQANLAAVEAQLPDHRA